MEKLIMARTFTLFKGNINNVTKRGCKLEIYIIKEKG